MLAGVNAGKGILASYRLASYRLASYWLPLVVAGAVAYPLYGVAVCVGTDGRPGPRRCRRGPRSARSREARRVGDRQTSLVSLVP